VPRYKLTIAYDGTDFCGWQKQEPPAGSDVPAAKVLSPIAPDPARMTLRTAQEVVERAVREVVREPVNLLGASRTDAGVHARGQTAAFTCSGDMAPIAADPDTASTTEASEPGPQPSRSGWPLARGTAPLISALNSRLPGDILITAAEPVAPTFDPISDCTSKGYSYTLHISLHRALFDRRYVQHLWTPLDVDRMNQAAARFVGEHDFAAFAAASHGRLTTVRTVFGCRVVEEAGVADRPVVADDLGAAAARGGRDFPPRRLRIDVSGSGFLYNMVRIIAGTLVEVGRGRMTPEDIGAAIESKDRRRAGPTMPAQGLCLEWVKYD